MNECTLGEVGMVAEPVIPNAQELQAGGLRVQGYPGLHTKILAERKRRNVYGI
jgi:hypothetical protein